MVIRIIVPQALIYEPLIIQGLSELTGSEASHLQSSIRTPYSSVINILLSSISPQHARLTNIQLALHIFELYLCIVNQLRTENI